MPIATPPAAKFSELRIRPAANGFVTERITPGAGSDWTNPVRTVHPSKEHLLAHMTKLFKPPQE